MNKTKIAIMLIADRYEFSCPWVTPLRTSDGRPASPPFVPKPNKKGYPVFSVRMRKRGISMKVHVHQVVGYKKYGSVIFEKGNHVRHLDNNKLNFRQDNLALGTPMDNYLDQSNEFRIRQKEFLSSLGKSNRTLSKDDLIQARKMREGGETYRSISEAFECAENTIRYALTGKSYLEA